MNGEIRSVRYNVMNISSVEGYCNIRGGFSNGCKDVYFVRLTGNDGTIAEKVKKLDSSLSGSNTIYNRISELPKPASADEAAYYNSCLSQWKNSGRKNAVTRRAEGIAALNLGSALSRTLDVFSKSRTGVSDSIRDNFAVKLLYWYDKVVPEIKGGFSGKETVKLCAENAAKLQDYLFFYMLTQCGFDVILFQYREDIDSTLEKYNFSSKITVGAFGDCAVPAYNPVQPAAETAAPSAKHPENQVVLQPENQPVLQPENQPVKQPDSGKIKMTIPQHPDRMPVAASFVNERPARIQRPSAEKTMEELAALAASVVLITIHNSRGDVIGTGSGIMISEKGYILTNNHVARGGHFYSVRIEDDDRVYRTDEIIKYNPVIDLAVIRIDRHLKPVPIYSGKKLVRGQKVVAIGSPLGLFNTVSDGIISGFRLIDSVEMIQFTAPISQGSSGGAILNMNGEVIGISTAGFDAGQNLNLAVSYEYINAFLMGLKN